jgi:hypothetical protein
VAALAEVDEAEFAHVRDTIEISDSVLSKQSAPLEAAYYVKIARATSASGPAPGSR